MSALNISNDSPEPIGLFPELISHSAPSVEESFTEEAVIRNEYDQRHNP